MVLFFLFVEAAGGGRHTAVIYVVFAANDTTAVKLSADIVRLPKGRNPTVRPKTVVGTDGVKNMKKTWMMQLL